MKTLFSGLFIATVVSSAHVNYLAPGASGYIYRSDNNGPPSLIQLGAAYQQPQLFAPPLPLLQPNQEFLPQLPLPIVQPANIEASEAYDLAPAPLPYVVEKPIIVVAENINDVDDDESDESSDEYLDSGDLVPHGHGHAYEKGSDSDYNEEHHAAHGEKGSKGYNSEGHHAKGEAGHYAKEHNEGYSSEKEEGKEAHHDEADAHGKHHESGENYQGGDRGHKEHFSKGEDITGYHKTFHKDEYKKDHDFYDVADNSGNFNKHGYEKGHHGSEKGGKKEAGHHDSAYDKGNFGKAGFHAKGHVDESNKNHSAEEGDESHYSHEEDFAKKGGSGHEKQYAFADADDDDDEDDY